MPGDYEAMVGQGPVTLHSEERPASSDRGVVMFRHRFRECLKQMSTGENPPAVSFDAEVQAARYEVRAGNYIGDRDEVIGGG